MRRYPWLPLVAFVCCYFLQGQEEYCLNADGVQDDKLPGILSCYGHCNFLLHWVGIKGVYILTSPLLIHP